MANLLNFCKATKIAFIPRTLFRGTLNTIKLLFLRVTT